MINAIRTTPVGILGVRTLQNGMSTALTLSTGATGPTGSTGPAGSNGSNGTNGTPTPVTLTVTSDDQVYNAVVNTRVSVINEGLRFQVRMPSSPSLGDTITFVDSSAQWGHIAASYTDTPTVGTGADQSGGQQWGATFRFPRFFLAVPDSVKTYSTTYDYWTQTSPANRQREITFIYRTNNTEVAGVASPAWFLVVPPDNRGFEDGDVAYISPRGFDAANAVTPGEAWPRRGNRSRPFISAQDAIGAGYTRLHFLADDPGGITLTESATLYLTSDYGAVIGDITVNPVDVNCDEIGIICLDSSIACGNITFNALPPNNEESRTNGANGHSISVLLRGLISITSTGIITLSSGAGQDAGDDDSNGGAGGTLNVTAEHVSHFTWHLTTGAGGANGVNVGGVAADGEDLIYRRWCDVGNADVLTRTEVINHASTRKQYLLSNPPVQSNATAPNNWVYYSTDAGRLVYKSPTGTVHNLY